MKKIILSLGALLAVSIASAQSYPKQPDKTVVTYVSQPQVKKEPKKLEVKNEDPATDDIKPAPAKPTVVRDDKLKQGTPALPKSAKNAVAVTGTTE